MALGKAFIPVDKGGLARILMPFRIIIWIVVWIVILLLVIDRVVLLWLVIVIIIGKCFIHNIIFVFIFLGQLEHLKHWMTLLMS